MGVNSHIMSSLIFNENQERYACSEVSQNIWSAAVLYKHFKGKKWGFSKDIYFMESLHLCQYFSVGSPEMKEKIAQN